MIHSHFIRSALLGAVAFSPVRADVLLAHQFGGAAENPLHNVAPDTNAIRPVPWNAGTILAANGQVTDVTNTDQGAVFDLGLSWQFKPQSTYRATLSFSNLDNAIVFAGFRTANASGGVQAQTQGTAFALRVREIAGSDNVGIFQWPGGAFTNAAELSYTANTSGSFELEIHTNDLTDATVLVGTAQITVDLSVTLYRYFFIGYEDPTTGTSDAKFDAVVLEGPTLPPLPQPAITAINRTTGDITVTWPTVLNERYTLQGSADLVTWTPVDNSDINPFSGTGEPMVVVDPRTEPQYFYRVIRP